MRNGAMSSGERVMVMAGAIAPLFLSASVLLLGSQQPRFNHIKNGISILGSSRTGAHPEVMNWLGFITTGLLLAVFALYLFRSVPSRLGKVAALSLFVGAAGLIGVGLVPLPNRLHHLVSLLTLFGSAAGILGLRKDLVEITGKRWLWNFSFIVFVVIVGSVGMLWVTRESGGLVQRLSIGMALVWVEIVALSILVAGRHVGSE